MRFEIAKLDEGMMQRAQARLDNLTKPQGSLGRLEELAKRIAGITGKEFPSLNRKVIFTLAADHGITDEGISPFPKEVTAQMVYNFVRGGAGINVLARQAGAKVIVADIGVAGTLDASQLNSASFKDRKVAFGTKNFAKGPAMTPQEAQRSVEAGVELFEEEYAAAGIDIVGTGELGIGNTTSSSAIAAVFTGFPIEKLVGRGAGLDDAGVRRKIEVVAQGLEKNGLVPGAGKEDPGPDFAMEVLAKVGGLEIGGLAGVMLAAASHRVPVVIDGFISTAAALIAAGIDPRVKQYLISSHCSVEQGHLRMLELLGQKPLFDLGMRLGEGTGAAIGMMLADASVNILTQMATFQSANVSGKVQ